METPNVKHNIIGTKWVFQNKHGEHEIVVHNKDCLIAQRFFQIEGMDYGETYALMARLEVINILLAFTNYHSITLFEIDVKSVF